MTDEVNVSAVLNVSERDEHRTKIEGLLRVAGFGQVVPIRMGPLCPTVYQRSLPSNPVASPPKTKRLFGNVQSALDCGGTARRTE